MEVMIDCHLRSAFSRHDIIFVCKTGREERSYVWSNTSSGRHTAPYDWKMIYNTVTLTSEDDIIPRYKGTPLNLAVAAYKSSAVISL